MNYFIEYRTNAADEFHVNILTISAARGAELVVTSNRGQRVTMGRFAFSPTADEVDALVLSVAAPEFFAQPNTLLVPGEVHRRITVLLDGRQEFHRLATRSTAGEAFSNAESVLLRIWDAATRHPTHALEIKVAIDPVQGREGSADATVTLSLRNPGPLSIAIPALKDWTSKRVGLTIVACRSDVPPGEFISPVHQTFLDLGSIALTQKPAGAGGTPIVIPPGASAVLQFRASLPLARGHYDVLGVFATPLFDEHGAEVLMGECVSAEQAIERD